MLGCTYGNLFKTTVAGGSYQEGLSINIQGVPPGYRFTEEEIYVELMLRKPGQGELTSPRREADVPILFSGLMQLIPCRDSGMPVTPMVHPCNLNSQRRPPPGAHRTVPVDQPDSPSRPCVLCFLPEIRDHGMIQSEQVSSADVTHPPLWLPGALLKDTGGPWH